MISGRYQVSLVVKMKFVESSLTFIIFFCCLDSFGQVVITQRTKQLNDTIFFKQSKLSADDSLSEYVIYRSYAHRRLNGYEKEMDKFSQLLSKRDEKVRLKNQASLVRLEKINASLRERIESYQAGRSWTSFKMMTTQAIDAFGQEVQDLAIEN